MQWPISSSIVLALVSFGGCGKSPAPDAVAAPAPDVAPTPAPAPDVALAPAPEVAPAPAPDVAPAPVVAAATCSAESTLKLDLAAVEKSFGALHVAFEKDPWRTEPKGDDGLPGIDAAKVPKFAPLLRQLGLVNEAKDLDIEPTETAFDVYDCTFSKTELAAEPGAKDMLVSLVCQNQSEPDFYDGKVLYAGVVLRSLGEGTWCHIGAIVWDTMLSARACLTDIGEGPAWKLTPVELVAAGRQAIQEDRLGGLCGAGTLRGDDITRSFWGVEKGQLVDYMGGVIIADAGYESPCPPTEVRSAEVSLGNDFPKKVTVSAEITCTPAEDGCEPDTTCKPRKGTETWAYADGGYDRVGPEALLDTAEVDPRGTSAAQLAASARMAMRQQVWDQAVTDFRKAYALDPELPRLRGELGWALFNEKQYVEARTLTEAALVKADKPASKGALLYNLGRIDEAEKKPADAIAHYKASLAARPKNDAVQKRLDALQKK